MRWSIITPGHAIRNAAVATLSSPLACVANPVFERKCVRFGLTELHRALVNIYNASPPHPQALRRKTSVRKIYKRGGKNAASAISQLLDSIICVCVRVCVLFVVWRDE